MTLTVEGLVRGAALLRTRTLEGLQTAILRRYLHDALRAREWYRRGPDYQLAGTTIAINAERGSRLAGAPRLEEGIRQAIEAREGLATSPEQAVWARITVGDYFRTYSRLCGISPVAARSSAELQRMYNLRTTTVPAGRPPTRVDHPDLAFDEAQPRFEALVRESAERHQVGQPVVIGVMTPQDGRIVRRMLDHRKIPFSAALSVDNEIATAEVIAAAMAEAGKTGSVTLLTAVASRGYDVTLDSGTRPAVASEPASPGGLAVLVAGRSRSWRSDQWLRGLAGRRGEPGESRFFLSLQDALLHGLQSRAWAKVPARIRRRADGAPLTSTLRRIIEETQQKAEQADFERLVSLQAIEDVESVQRAHFYSWREELLWAGDLKNHVSELIDEVVELFVKRYGDPGQLLSALALLYPTRLTIGDLMPSSDGLRAGALHKERAERVKWDARAAYERHEQFMGQAAMRATERRIISSLLGSNWSQHLSMLEAMRTANSDLSPHDWLSAYTDEANKRYTAVLERIKERIIGYVFRSEPAG